MNLLDLNPSYSIGLGSHSTWLNARRIRNAVSESPVVWFIFYTLAARFFKSNSSILKMWFDQTKSNSSYKTMWRGYSRELCPSPISPKYKKQYHQLHATNEKYGRVGRIQPHIKRIIGSDIVSILDFGCGKGRLQHPKYDIHHYDPASPRPEIALLPKRKFDAVISLDVFEHIPQNQLTAAFQWLEIFAREQVVLPYNVSNSRAVLSNIDPLDSGFIICNQVRVFRLKHIV